MRHHGGARQGVVVHQLERQQLDRAHHHGRRDTDYSGPTISSPVAITAGPDGALWFTNASNNSIGRITTAGVVTNYTNPTIADPDGITAGPDGAMWFTDRSNNSIGRITTAGVVTKYTNPTISDPDGDRGRARRRFVVHQLRQQLDRADHGRAVAHSSSDRVHLDAAVRSHGR